MIKYKLKSLFEQDSVPKQLNITFLNDSSRTYSNEDISSEQCTLTESLCSQESLKFGACEASSVKFTIMNDNKSWQNAEIKLELILNNDTSNPFTIGTFYVNEDTPSSDRANREITAYDKMYTLLTQDVTSWYTEFWKNRESCTIKEFRDALCSYLGVQQENVSLINDTVSIPKSVEDEVVTVQNLLEDLGEFNACFPHFNRNNQLTYIYIQDPETRLYPGATTFPGNDVYPNTPSNLQHTEIFDTTKYIDFQYSDFDILKCTGVCFKQSETDAGVISKSSDDNIYTITNNRFARALNTDILVNVAKNIFDKLQKITYTPVTQLTKLHSNLCTEVGDNVIINTKDKKINTVLLERTATGIQGISDAYISKGSLKYPDVNSDNTLASAVEKLKNSTHTLINDARQLKSEISDKVSTSVFDQTSEYINEQVTRLDANDTALSGRINVTAEAVNTEVTRAKGAEESLSGRITVAAGEITQEVSRATSEENTLRASISLKIDKDDDGQIISMINESADVITLNSNRLVVNSSNFTLDRNGNVSVSGIINATSGSVGGWKFGRGYMYSDGESFVSSHSYTNYYSWNGYPYKSSLYQGKLICGVQSGASSEGVPNTNYGYCDLSVAGFYSKDIDLSSGYLFAVDVKNATVTTNTGAFTASDRRLKTNINEIDERYANDLIDNLKPSTYKMIDGKRTHSGFIADEVKQTAEKVLGTAEDFAAYATVKIDEDKHGYAALRYEEFIAPLTKYCQCLKRDLTQEIERNQQLQFQLLNLQGEIAIIKQKIGGN